MFEGLTASTLEHVRGHVWGRAVHRSKGQQLGGSGLLLGTVALTRMLIQAGDQESNT
jgi:hypothetical protein